MTILMCTLKLVAFLTLSGELDGLPRSLADDLEDDVVEQQDDPSQDPLKPPIRPRKDDFVPREAEEPLLEHRMRRSADSSEPTSPRRSGRTSGTIT